MLLFEFAFFFRRICLLTSEICCRIVTVYSKVASCIFYAKDAFTTEFVLLSPTEHFQRLLIDTVQSVLVNLYRTLYWFSSVCTESFINLREFVLNPLTILVSFYTGSHDQPSSVSIELFIKSHKCAREPLSMSVSLYAPFIILSWSLRRYPSWFPHQSI